MVGTGVLRAGPPRAGGEGRGVGVLLFIPRLGLCFCSALHAGALPQPLCSQLCGEMQSGGNGLGPHCITPKCPG